MQRAECGWRDSNSHALRDQILSLACLPFQHTRNVFRTANISYSLDLRPRGAAALPEISEREAFRAASTSASTDAL